MFTLSSTPLRRIARAATVTVAAVATATALTACSSGGSSGNGQIAIISKGYQHQFWKAVNKGAEESAKELGKTITFEGPDSETQVEKQVQLLQTALDRNPSAIAIAALDSSAVAPILQQAKDKGIPVIAFDSGVDSDIPVTTASTNNFAAAGEAAKRMVELIGGKGEIGVVAHDQTSKTGVDRRDGFTDWIKKNAPGVKIVDVQYGGDPAKAADLTSTMLEAYPNLAGLYGTNEGAATGVVNAAQRSGKKNITIVGFDSGAAQIDAIKSGLMAGAITQNPLGIGRETVAAAVKAINKESLPKTIDTGYYWYDKTNIDDPKISGSLYR
ncbi:Periplasmic binding protein/LacI transcriptional regulator OS=Tsukamurella paurometabola (strain ATCC 8368 / DSM / CCUG 35730 / CIP 100753 / JCM 10117 /KCTC 9821 / NBRC 16120 / NCIMB 702349 / NCTC 13040) OX=521096 GN=Tpau_3102 PE=3 SV=1 [Tsukamurella paurometabola]|uniref:Periplasmic binding protein/LacI transcriptional regulator n=1 Tax=Tsukamurella paurometabola (strain ATCC 8368 / DSM 20162 / CCUG 35730 / CIP 100753 / JCM 10117 / KCTC 9821 / NBRC 16120 / NCIMB 702349 / NCTC 13040) TaxID=521096 RepID=D5UUX4_TSUPD|nr:ABC transporter substrate-binding protein [Tsukamurella paurometabola]ADG79692.1 periplasmic binding protein/LacI transcriptional regulator [Tsukamurella paurometabola DSM 20162]SUP36789.1 D-allose-binding periplasmic protein precursor [Tsukamurella paurometabola]